MKMKRKYSCCSSERHRNKGCNRNDKEEEHACHVTRKKGNKMKGVREDNKQLVRLYLYLVAKKQERKHHEEEKRKHREKEGDNMMQHASCHFTCQT